MDAAQSSCALGIGRVLDVPGPLENSFSLSRRRKITKCQLLRDAPQSLDDDHFKSFKDINMVLSG